MLVADDDDDEALSCHLLLPSSPLCIMHKEISNIHSQDAIQ
jgi:hypothetical protein